MQMLLEFRNIHFRYPGTEKVIFDNLSFGFTQPGFHAIFGPSGVGKTSLAHLITGRITPDRGNISVNGLSPLFYSYNMERLPGWSSVGRHLERITPSQKIDERDELVNAFGLRSLLKHRFSQLSMGQQNRINLLRYLIQDCRLLIMDESLANVDEKTRGEILLKIKEMYPDVLFISISHNVVEVAKFCQDIWVLRDIQKSPQIQLVNGCDYRRGNPVPQNQLQTTMLEIMNAA